MASGEHGAARTATGVFLLLMPMQYVAIGLLAVYGVAQYREVSAIKEVVLVAAPVWFWLHGARQRLMLPDVLLGVLLLVVAGGQIFNFNPGGVRVDWEWVLPYALGRVMVLDEGMQRRWAKGAVWMCAGLAVLGAWEVFVLGDGPRRLLLAATAGDAALPDSFTAAGYAGLRAASTTVSPLSFSAFCMVGLVLWWVYMRNVVPAALVGAGLVLTLTRSAVVATLVGIAAVAVRRHERARMVGVGLVLAVGLAVAVPVLGLKGFVQAGLSGRSDPSLQVHEASLADGVRLALEHPGGIGAGTVGPRTLLNAATGFDIESTYLTIAVEYGLVVGVLFAGFVGACLWATFRVRRAVGYAAFGCLLGYGLLLGVGPLHQDITVACWVWFLVGQGVSASGRAVGAAQGFEAVVE